MATATRTSDITSALKYGVQYFWTQDDQLPTEYTEIFDEHKSTQQVETDTMMRGTGYGQPRAEGSPTVFDNMAQSYTTQYTNRVISLGFSITMEARLFNLYKKQLPKDTVMLRDSMRQTREVIAASVLNNASNPLAPGGDGKPLLSTAHPIYNGSFANTSSIQADLSEASLESYIIMIQKFPKESGLRDAVKPRKLVVSLDNQFVAGRLLLSPGRTRTDNNDINVIKAQHSIPEGYVVNRYLLLKRSWFILTTRRAMKYQKYLTDQINAYTDPDTDTYKIKATDIYCFGWGDPRAVAGSASF